MKTTLLKKIGAMIVLCLASFFVCDMVAENRVADLKESNDVLVAPDSIVQQRRRTIIDELGTPGANGGYVQITQSSDITDMLRPRRDAGNGMGKGYRIQIYSSNRGQEARERAFKIEKEVLDKHPNLDVYVTYTAPFWKVRIGNCISYEDAQRVRRFMMDEFPAYATEINIVPSAILLME